MLLGLPVLTIPVGSRWKKPSENPISGSFTNKTSCLDLAAPIFLHVTSAVFQTFLPFFSQRAWGAGNLKIKHCFDPMPVLLMRLANKETANWRRNSPVFNSERVDARTFPISQLTFCLFLFQVWKNKYRWKRALRKNHWCAKGGFAKLFLNAAIPIHGCLSKKDFHFESFFSVPFLLQRRNQRAMTSNRELSNKSFSLWRGILGTIRSTETFKQRQPFRDFRL